MNDLDAFFADVAQSAYGWPDSLRFTYQTVRRLIDDEVGGCLVECGVGNGVHPAVMGRACLDAGEARVIHLFDSFQGLPNGDKHDIEWNRSHPSDGQGTLVGSGVCVCSRQAVEANLERWLPGVQPPFVYHEGWFQDTVPRDSAGLGPVAFLRLDGDLYESTKVCLEWLYPLVARGGVVVIDDLNLDGCASAFREYMESGVCNPVIEPTQITTSGDVYWVKLA